MDLRVAVLRLTPVMRARLLETSWRTLDNPVFACPVPTRTKWKLRRRWLVVFVDRPTGAPSDGIFGLGIVIPGNRATSYEQRVEVETFVPLPVPLPVHGIANRLKSDAVVLDGDGPMTPGRGHRLFEALIAEFPQLAEQLHLLAAEVTVPVETGDAAGNALSQRDASNVLLTAMNMDRAPIRDWTMSMSSGDFYQNIPGEAVPHEDDLIRWDSQRMPGWPDSEAVDWTARRHWRAGRELRIYYANTRSLERQTGVDLVYYNVHHGCFVLVQYKKFNPEAAIPVYWPDSDGSFDKELERMRKIDKACAETPDPSDIVLTQSAAFFKFCEPMPFEPGSQDLVPGMYLSRMHVEALLERGPRPGYTGRRIDYEATPRYLNNTMFAGLLGDGWIGTRGAGTELVAQQVATSLGLGRAVVIGASPQNALGNSVRR